MLFPFTVVTFCSRCLRSPLCRIPRLSAVLPMGVVAVTAVAVPLPATLYYLRSLRDRLFVAVSGAVPLPVHFALSFLMNSPLLLFWCSIVVVGVRSFSVPWCCTLFCCLLWSTVLLWDA